MSEIINTINRQLSPEELEVAGVISRARMTANGRPTYICPFCGNGTGKSGDGLAVYSKDGKLKYHCFGKCGRNYSAFDLIAAYEGYTNLDSMSPLEKSQVAEKAKERFNLTEENNNFNFSIVHNGKKIVPSPAERPKKDYAEFYKTARLELKEFVEKHGGKFRGLTYDQLFKYCCGYRENFKTVFQDSSGEQHEIEIPRFIVPSNRNHFLARFVGNFADLNLPANVTEKDIKPKQHFGSKTIFGVNMIPKDAKIIFVTEGEFDAMSIDQCGYPAVSVSGSKITGEMQEEWKNFSHDIGFVILLDNDETGEKNADENAKIIDSLGYHAAIQFLDKKYKDANEFLQADPDGLAKNLEEIFQEVKKLFANATKKDGVKILADAFDLLDEYSKKIQDNLLEWGFPTLDEKLPLLPGCYLIGALPSLGKTTFCLNVAQNICEQGKKVLYVSYEPTFNQIALKDLASYWFKKNWNDHKNIRPSDSVPSVSQILLGRYGEMFNFAEMQAVREELKSKRQNFYFLQGKKQTAENLISEIKPYVDKGVKFVVVDYVQLIKGADSTKTAREQIDATIRELQIFQSENDLVILFISSFNRENYRNYACIESFKESGGLEYTADAILALQFKYSDREVRSDPKIFAEKKQARPRNMEIVCLKNRLGNDFVDEFAYHSAHETFIEKRLHKTDSNKKFDDIS